MAWTYFVNETPANGDDAWIYVVAMLMAEGWTVPQWSDGLTVHTTLAPGYAGNNASVTAFSTPTATITGLSGMSVGLVGQMMTFSGASSGGNNGTFLISAFISPTSVQITNVGAVAPDANNGSIHWVLQLIGRQYSWFRMRSPADPNTGQFRELVVQNGSTTGGTQNQWGLKYSASAGFTAFAGTALNTPMASDEVMWSLVVGTGILGSSSSTTSSFGFNFPNDGTYVFHGAAGDSTQNYSSYFAFITNSTTTLDFGFMLDIPTPWTGTSCLDSAILYAYDSVQAFNIFNFGVSTLSFEGTITGGMVSSLTGTTASITGATPNPTLTGLSSMSSLIVGETITISNAVNSHNNGTFTVTAWISPTSVQISNPGAVIPDGNNGSLHWNPNFILAVPVVQPPSWQPVQCLCPNYRVLPPNSWSGNVPIMTPMWGHTTVHPNSNRALGLSGYSKICYADLGSAARTNKDLFTVVSPGDYIWINGSLLPWPTGISPI